MLRRCFLLTAALLLARGAALGQASGDETIFSSPEAPSVGGMLRIMAVSERPVDGVLTVTSPDGQRVASSGDRRGGPTSRASTTVSTT